MRRLRAPDGCPWDREQTFDSIRPHTLEETYEVLEAIDERNWPGLREELGDLLLQVLFYAQMAAEAGHFDMDGVLTTLAEKLVRRHPHVFGENAEAAHSPAEALGRWNAMKAKEKGGEAPRSLMDGVPKDLPALAESVKLGQRAARVGFDWPTLDGIWDKLDEELRELRAELPAPDTEPDDAARRRLEDELGDVLLTVTSLARRLDLHPEAALKAANRKFIRRFQAMEAQARAEQRPLEGLTAADWDALWERAKSGRAPQES